MQVYSEQDLKKFMQECVKLAIENPRDVNKPHVGAVVVNQNHIVGRGKKRYDSNLDLELHAELVALLDAGIERSRGALLVTTLEPCCPIGEYKPRVRSCCEQILEYRIHEVVYGLLDSSPTIRDAMGVHFLSRNGVKTTHLTNFDYPVRTLMYRRNDPVRPICVDEF